MITIGQLDDRAIHVSDVKRGLACGAVCVDCGSRFIARQGERKVHHFAHYTQTNCQGEGNLHRMAKQILKHERRLAVRHPESRIPAMQMFESAQVEVTRGAIRVDCLMEIGSAKNWFSDSITELAIEIKVSHGIGVEKKAELRRLGLSTIEIDISWLADADYAPSTDQIRSAVCDTPYPIMDLETPEARQFAMDLNG